MPKITVPLLVLLAISRVNVCAFSVQGKASIMSETASRSEFLNTLSNLAICGAGVAFAPSFSYARGRGTLKESYDRYTPRIISGGKFYKNELKKLIEKNDWKSIKLATDEPPKKTKADRVKIDGGVAERAALAGSFSDSRVLVACDLFAGAFSDNSISPKTKVMKAEVENMREVVSNLNATARSALGEEQAGGMFGFGAKRASPADLAKTARKLYIDGGNAYNAYIYAANDELMLSLPKLPYL